MDPTSARPITISVDDTPLRVSGLWQDAPDAKACFVMAHGAGAGMRQAFLESLAAQLATLRIATLRYQFPYRDRGSKRPDPPKLCHAVVRAAVAEASRRTALPLLAGGRSFGGRMTSQAQAEHPLPGVRGLVFLAFPLHPAKRPGDERARHLFDVNIPMLFLQGTRDELAEMTLLEPVVTKLGTRATLKVFEHADHSYHVPARSGKRDADVLMEVAQTVAAWANTLL
ncbi:MAG TPA: alpha/beta family hydrolase [Steroidobacteraceae bacterium]|nr:alpha/beta family hydrolase [Steroidobacteraceae bacterium]